MSKLFWGSVFIVGGVLLLLLQATSVFPAGLPFWPAVAVIFGVYLCLRALFRDRYPLRRRLSWIMLALGALVATWGIIDILHANGYTVWDGREAIGRSWPVILVAIGLGLIFGRSEDDEDGGPNGRGGGRKSGWLGAWETGDLARSLGPDWWGWHRDPPVVQRYMSRVGDVHIGRKPWRLDGAFELLHSVGDVRVDLTTAEISPGEHRVRIQSSIGEVVVLVPSNCSVKASASASIGSVQIFDEEREGWPAWLEESVSVPGSEVTLDIRVRTRIGSVSIRRVRSVQPSNGREHSAGGGHAAEKGGAADRAKPAGGENARGEQRTAEEAPASEEGAVEQGRAPDERRSTEQGGAPEERGKGEERAD